MSGRTEIFILAVYAISAVAAITDLWRGRIYNWLTLPFIVAGWIASAILMGWSGFLDSFSATFVGFLLYGWMFWLGTMGGGDVKFLMALGSLGGLQYVVEVGLLGVLLGGLMSVGILLVKGRLLTFARRLYRFVISLVIKELVVETPSIDRKLTMPFGVPIAAAAIWAAVDHPLARLGVPLWS